MARKRSKQVVFRMTDEEFEKFEEKVEKSNLSKNEFLLRNALNKKIVVIDGEEDFKNMRIEIRRIGNNVNQIAKRLNEDKGLRRKKCLVALEDLKNIDKELMKIWQLLKQLAQNQV